VYGERLHGKACRSNGSSPKLLDGFRRLIWYYGPRLNDVGGGDLICTVSVLRQLCFKLKLQFIKLSSKYTSNELLTCTALSYCVFKDRLEGKRPLWKPLWRWDVNIKMYLNEIMYEFVDCIFKIRVMDQWSAHLGTIFNLPVPQEMENFLTSWRIVTFLKKAVLEWLNFGLSKSVIQHCKFGVTSVGRYQVCEHWIVICYLMVLCGCEIWWPTSVEGHGSVRNRALRVLFSFDWGVTEGWR